MRLLAIIPNALSALRLGLAAWFPFAPPDYRLPILIACGVSDIADGYIARRYKVTSWVGGLLDALADKFLALSVLLTFAMERRLEAWQVLPLLSRDLAVAFIAAYAAATGKWYAFRHMPARPLGKLTTAMMFGFFTLALTLVRDHSAGFWAAYAAAAACSTLAALDYMVVFVRARRRDRAAPG